MRLVRRDPTASGRHATALGLAAGTSLGLLVLDVSEGVDPVDVERVVHEELEEFASAGPGEAELQASRAETERSWLEALGSFDERAELLGRATAVHRDPQQINTYLDEVMAVTAEQVREAAARWLRPGSAATIRYLRPALAAAPAQDGSGAGRAAAVPEGGAR